MTTLSSSCGVVTSTFSKPSSPGESIPAASGGVPEQCLAALQRDVAPQIVGDRHDFVHADASSVAGLAALVAPYRSIERHRGRFSLGNAHRALRVAFGRVRTTTVGTEPSHQALRDNADQSRRGHIGLDADIGQACYARRRIVGVKGRHYQVARLGRLHRDLRRLMVTDFAERSVVVKAREAGANEFIGKPLKPIDLYNRILSVVHSPRSFVFSSDYRGPDRGPISGGC